MFWSLGSDLFGTSNGLLSSFFPPASFFAGDMFFSLSGSDNSFLLASFSTYSAFLGGIVTFFFPFINLRYIKYRNH